MKAFREHGVRQDGQLTALAWAKDIAVRGKDMWSVTTDVHEQHQIELIDLAKMANADRTAALSLIAMDRSTDGFLARNPQIDRNGRAL